MRRCSRSATERDSGSVPAAADQDPSFREHFYRRLLPELREAGRTVFVISHDERYYELEAQENADERLGVLADELSPWPTHPDARQKRRLFGRRQDLITFATSGCPSPRACFARPSRTSVNCSGASA